MPQIRFHPIIAHGSGEQLGVTVIEFGNPNSAHAAYIQGSLHGAELMGSVVILELAERLISLESSINGFIRLVPACNPVGIGTKVFNAQVGRVNLTDFEDWNRIFHRLVKKVGHDDSCDYEVKIITSDSELRARWSKITKSSDAEKIVISLKSFALHHTTSDISQIQKELNDILWNALSGLHNEKIPYYLSSSELLGFELEKLSFGADTIMDLHTNSGVGAFYTYFFEWQRKSLPYLGVDCGLKMMESESKAFDECNGQGWAALWRLFIDNNDLHKFYPDFNPPVELWTVELGSGNNINRQDAKLYADKIMNYLCYRGFIPGNPQKLSSEVYISREGVNLADTKYSAPCSGFFYPSVKPGAVLEAGDELGKIVSLNQLKKYAKQCEIPEKMYENLSVSLYAREKAFVLNHIDSAMVFQGMTLFQVMEDF
ncbi:succinylglutamate desuccinylase/aspartoacylase family protein [Microcoleus sp. FACHB-SPT15]|uniref:succinylglutamate desuccinylase/aspartoacylase family protein n=1 Tax=Microcoleus sp. FACHB-SPT15 TaxID=2692830 RepID=UPI001780F6BD|nr:succinylglutamate desuccinylase/aspartoacylase family protein [Microcoleus sp. FACHB-SPT15]MBD1803893.1 succinylglutamate desuccinylase/aspartoacylase family protein [Microcoleus sp. FACHB-SPT15]